VTAFLEALERPETRDRLRALGFTPAAEAR
jgi:hypothetical protein